MRVGLAQINPTLGDFENNRIKILECIERAVDRRCNLVAFPELALFGYWPADLLERESLVEAQLKELDRLEGKVPEGIAVVVGAVTFNGKKVGKRYHNSAVLLQKGHKRKSFHKELLPNYDVFDEHRHFEPGDMGQNVFKINGENVLVTICEDIWGWGEAWTGTRYPENPFKKVRDKKVSLILNLSASPFSRGKQERRLSVVRQTSKYMKAPVAYINQVGGQDELIYDGGSLVVDKKGDVKSQSVFFEEDLNVYDLETFEGGNREVPTCDVELTHQALVVGLRDFVQKNGFEKVHLGLSGGIDSAVVACLAVDALGPGKVQLFWLPGPYSSDESEVLARELAKNLHCELMDIPITSTYENAAETFEAACGGLDFGIVHENMQARLRGFFLMAYSNKMPSSMLLTTGNKSEYAVGYATLYGDMCGGVAVIADLLKTEVFELAENYNKEHELIPKRIIQRPPTAELRPNQKDEDSLPPYNELDKAIQKIVVECRPARSKTEKWLLAQLNKTEFKRWQAPPILRVSQHAFGRGRRFPITHRSSK